MRRVATIILILLLLFFSGCKKSEGDNSSSDLESSHSKEIESLDRAQEFFDGSLAACEKDGKWGYISKDGQWYITAKYESAANFSNGAAAVSVMDKNKGEIFGYISSSGEYLDYMHPSYKSAGNFSSEGFAKVKESESDYYYIKSDATLPFSERIIDFGESYYEAYINAFNFATDFKHGYALVGEYNPVIGQLEYYVISKEGEIAYKFDEAYYNNDIFVISLASPDENGYCIVAKAAEGKLLFGVIDLSGKTVIDFKYEEILPISDEMFALKLSGKWGFINRSGETVIDFKYADAKSFQNGSAAVSDSKKWGIIDTQGEWIIKPTFEDVSENGFSQGILAYKKNGLWGYVSSSGEIITEAVFSAGFDFCANAARIADSKGLFGYINKSGEVIIEPIFENSLDFYYTNK